MFARCFPNTLDTTIFFNGDEKQPDTFVITGNIDAMWLRDSSAQVQPYPAARAKRPQASDNACGRYTPTDPQPRPMTTIRQCLRWLHDTTANTGFMHESFNKDNPAQYTRPWFAWANTLFGELILQLAERQPTILQAAL